MNKFTAQKSNADDTRRNIPSVDAIINKSGKLIDRWGHQRVTAVTRSILNDVRTKLGLDNNDIVSVEFLVEEVERTLNAADKSSFKEIINLTGTVLHTNFGRAVLPGEAIDAINRVASSPTNLEYVLADGKRGERDDHVEKIICELLGSEAATVVNNNAAALLLVLNTLAENGEIPVSRGELVEIGGSFRIPDIMQKSGCKLIEIGATNRTHLKDYSQAINSKTSLLMKVHTSNFKIQGFTTEVKEKDLAQLAQRANIPLVCDIGSGNIIDLSQYGLPKEITVGSAIQDGADIVTFSGDKLLGGPQSGIIVGKKELISRIRNNPLRRALRPDKITLAALHEVLKFYRSPEKLIKVLPTFKFLLRNVEDIMNQADAVVIILKKFLPSVYSIKTETCFSQIGSGALPIQNIPSFGITITAKKDSDLRALLKAFRLLPRPVIGRLNDKKLLLDLRCLDCEDQFSRQIKEIRDLLKCS